LYRPHSYELLNRFSFSFKLKLIKAVKLVKKKKKSLRQKSRL
jgi:hypothetical protein